MKKKKKKEKRRKITAMQNLKRTSANEILSYRAFSIRSDGKGPDTIDPDKRSLEIVVATEAPTNVFDFERFEIVPEVLVMAGAVLPKGRQVPLLDTHQRFETSSVLGSIRELKVEGDQLVGRAHFSSAPEVESVWIKAREGHLTDFSAGYKPIKSHWIPEGESFNYRGKTYNGPLRLTQRWKIREGSVVAIGADELAKARADTTRNESGDNDMEKTEIESIKTQERERVQEITAMCKRFDFEDLANDLISDGISVDNARKVVLDRLESQSPDKFKYYAPYDSPAIISIDETDKRVAATVDGLTLRAGVKLEKPAPGSMEYRVLSLVDIGKESLLAQGVNVRGMSKSRIVAKALTTRAAWTGDFPDILAGTANKVLRQRYQEAPSTFELWTNQTDGNDFKEISRVQLSEGPDLDEIPELGEYTYGKFGESKEVFQITKHGKLFAISREAIINDDLGAFTRVPEAFARSAKRKLNQAPYAALAANSVMGDGKALFHADHGNYVGTGSAPDETTLNAGRLAMRTQTGLQGATLNITPMFLIVPAALETTADKLLNSLGDLSDYKSSGVINPFYKKLEPIIESYLDSVSSTAWYLAANPRTIDTVEVCFLNGQRTPYLEQKSGWTVDGTEYKVRFEYGVKAIDWRGLYCNEGD